MSQIFKTAVTIFCALFIAFSGVGIISADKDTSQAERYYQSVVDQIECSNLSSSVIDACVTSTSNNTDYVLTTNKITDDTGKIKAVEVILKYKYKINFFNINKEHTKQGYAR